VNDINTTFTLDLPSSMSPEDKHQFQAENQQIYQSNSDAIVTPKTLSQCQTEALNEISEWLKTEQTRFYKLIGSAGTGKSFLTGKIIEFAIALELEVAIIAPTHKALKNCKNFAPRSVHFATLAGYLGKMPVLAQDKGKEEFRKVKELDKSTLGLVIIDECSMISRDDINDILHDKTYDNFILFVGDDKQLPPIGEKRSFVWDLNIPSSTLKEIVRYSGELLALATNIGNGKPHPILQSADGTLDVVIDSEQFLRSYCDGIREPISRGNEPSAKMIAWRNRTVSHWNDAIRANLGFSHDYQVKDRLVATKPLFKPTPKFLAKLPCHHSEMYSIHADLGNEYVVVNSVQIARTIDIPRANKTIEIDTYSVECINDLGFLETFSIVSPDCVGYWQSLVKKAIDAKDWHLWRILTCSFDALDYAYAQTVHKSQGSTFDVAYVDYRDVSLCPDYQPMVYTALTRGKKAVILK
jgi:AAA domain/UvrD-like helicase C-terminal domain